MGRWQFRFEYKECSVDSCECEVKARGYCEKHYRRLMKNGTVDDENIRKVDTGDDITRFHKKYVINEFDCWVWIGSTIQNKDYPRHWSNNGHYVSARKFAYELRHGNIDKDTYFSLKCSTDLCVNPDHFVLLRKGQP